MQQYEVATDRAPIVLALRTAHGSVLPLRGAWLACEANRCRLFVGAPTPMTSEDVQRLGITIDDFALSDPWLNALVLADENVAIQADAQKRIRQLKDERAKLSLASDQARDARRAIMNILRDVADAKQRAEETHAELERAHRSVRHLLEAISSALIAVDAAGRVTAVNSAAQRTLRLDKHAIGNSFQELQIEWDAPAAIRAVDECLLRQQLVRISENALPPPGRYERLHQPDRQSCHQRCRRGVRRAPRRHRHDRAEGARSQAYAGAEARVDRPTGGRHRA